MAETIDIGLAPEGVQSLALKRANRHGLIAGATGTGKTITMQDGSAKMDENYVKESILYPAKRSRPGFPNSMPSFEGQLKDKEIEGLVAYIKSLK